MEKCVICSEYMLFKSHKCKPQWLVWEKDDNLFLDAYDSKYAKVFADTPEKAAKEWHARSFDGEGPKHPELYVLPMNEADTLAVDFEEAKIDAINKKAEEQAKLFECWIEAEPVFCAEEKIKPRGSNGQTQSNDA